MKRLPILSIVLLMTACATQALKQTYQPPNYDGPPWVISSSFNEVSGLIELIIDDTIVTRGVLSYFGDISLLKGKYQGRDVAAQCLSLNQSGMTKRRCNILVDRERAVTLDF